MNPHTAQSDNNTRAVQSQQVNIRSAAISAVVRKHVLDQMVPAVTALKGTLEERRSPLQKQAFECLVRLMIEHKAHMEEALVAHRQLAQEVTYHVQVRAASVLTLQLSLLSARCAGCGHQVRSV